MISSCTESLKSEFSKVNASQRMEKREVRCFTEGVSKVSSGLFRS